MKKKLLIVFLTIISAACVAAAFTACGGIKLESDGSFNFNLLEDDTYAVYLNGSFTDADVVIPSTYKGKAVTQLNTMSNKSFIESVTIPDSITKIENGTFTGCKNLKSVTLPNSITTIPDNMFSVCVSLKSITIPDSVTTIERSAFHTCSSLEDITFGKGITSIGQWAFSGCENIKNVYITDLSGWCNIEFVDKIESGIIIPESLVVGGNPLSSNPLSYGSNLYLNGEIVTDLVIPDDVTSISDTAFTNCAGIKSLTLGGNVTEIGDYAFYNCNLFENLILPDGLTSIGDCAFAYCSSINGLTIPESVVYLGNHAFDYCTSMKDLKVSSDIEHVELSYLNCENASVPAYFIKYLGKDNLKTVEITDSDTIEFAAFYGFRSLLSVTLCEGITSIGDDAFSGCYNLLSITLPHSLTQIGEFAFSKCYKLVEIYNFSELEITKGSSDYGNIGENALAVYTSADDESKIVYTEDNFIFYDKPGISTLLGYCGNDTQIKLPANFNGKNYTMYYTFYSDKNLQSVVISDGVISIDLNVFYDCRSLESIAVTTGNNYYYSEGNCIIEKQDERVIFGIANSVIPDGVRTIGEKAFNECSGLTEITIPESVTVIEDYAFYYCSKLTSLTLTDGLISIGSVAFCGCNSLTDIYFEGTMEQWENLNFNTGDYTVHCTDGDIEKEDN